MSKESRVPFPLSPDRSQSHDLFNTAAGALQRHLQLEEYHLLKFSPTFESDFVQVSKKGGILDVHNKVQLVRVAIATTNQSLQIPNALLLARPVMLPKERRLGSQTKLQHTPRMKFELTRLLPLCFVKISIHNLEKKQLRFKLVTGRTFYLQLCPLQEIGDDVFEAWIKIVHLLRPPSKTKVKVLEQAGEPGPEQEVPQQAEERSVQAFIVVAKEDPRAEIQEEAKEEEAPTEPSQDQQNTPEDSSSATTPPSQDEITEEETPPLSVNQSSEEQLEVTSVGSKEWTPTTTPPASRKTINRSKFHRIYSSQKASSHRKFSSLLKSFSNHSQSNKKVTKSKGNKSGGVEAKEVRGPKKTGFSSVSNL